MIDDAIKKAFEKKEIRGWDKWPKMYVLIDLHDVIIAGTYTRNNDGKKLYPYAKDVLKNMTKNNKLCLILWTSSHKDAIDDICLWLKDFDIQFDYINENPECFSTEILNVESKLYFDLLFDDKAGFVGNSDWLVVKDALMEVGEWLD